MRKVLLTLCCFAIGIGSYAGIRSDDVTKIIVMGWSDYTINLMLTSELNKGRDTVGYIGMKRPDFLLQQGYLQEDFEKISGTRNDNYFEIIDTATINDCMKSIDSASILDTLEFQSYESAFRIVPAVEAAAEMSEILQIALNDPTIVVMPSYDMTEILNGDIVGLIVLIRESGVATSLEMIWITRQGLERGKYLLKTPDCINELLMRLYSRKWWGR